MSKKTKRILIIILAIVIIAVVIFSYFYTDKFTKFPSWLNISSSSSENSSSSSSGATSGNSATSSSSSSANTTISSSSSSSSSIVDNLLYSQYKNDYNYIDKFASANQNYQQLQDKTGVCRVHFVDVGQGDCMIIELPDDKIMVIDAGDRDLDIEVSIEQYLTKLGVTKVDYLLATHQDADHIGNMDAIFDNTEVKYVYRPYVLSTNSKAESFSDVFNKGVTKANGGSVSDTATYANFLQMILDEKYGALQTSTGWEFFNKDTQIEGSVTINSQQKEYYFDFLTPTANVEDIAYKDANDYSPIVLFNYLGVDVLFTGDAEKEVMQEYLDTYSNTYDIDVLKVGHHGSNTSTSDEYVKALKPEYSVIQVGEGNKHKHPRQTVLDILYNNDSTVFRNDKNGDIVLTICPDGSFFFETEKRSDYQLQLNGYPNS